MPLRYAGAAELRAPRVLELGQHQNSAPLSRVSTELEAGTLGHRSERRYEEVKRPCPCQESNSSTPPQLVTLQSSDQNVTFVSYNTVIFHHHTVTNKAQQVMTLYSENSSVSVYERK
jgi:hypothetical protein